MNPNPFYKIYAVLSIGLGLNFIFWHPAFMPLDVPKVFIGSLFFACGFTKSILLLLDANRVSLRLSMAVSVTLYSFWAGLLTYEFFRLHQTSMQLPLTYIGLAVIGYKLLTLPLSNLTVEIEDK